MKRQAILFDLDGTLLDTHVEFTHCINQVLATHQRQQVDQTDFRSHISFGAKGMVSYAFGLDRNSQELQPLVEAFLIQYQQQLGEKTKLFDGIEQLLINLNQKGIPWGIVTNKSTRFAEPLVAQFPVFDSAQCLVCGDTLPTAKPSGEPLLYALKQMKPTINEAIYVGDAQTDVEASRHAGMLSVIATYGFIPHQSNPLDWQADHYVDEALALENYIALRCLA